MRGQYHQLNVDDEKEIKVKLKTYTKRILFAEHFRIVEKNGDKIRAVCKHCTSVLKSSLTYNLNFRDHLKVFLLQFEH